MSTLLAKLSKAMEHGFTASKHGARVNVTITIVLVCHTGKIAVSNHNSWPPTNALTTGVDTKPSFSRSAVKMKIP